MTDFPIITTYNPRASNLRELDWTAVRSNHAHTMPVGVGKTSEEAVANLLDLEEELKATLFEEEPDDELDSILSYVHPSGREEESYE